MNDIEHGLTLKEIINNIDNLDSQSERDKLVARTRLFYKIIEWTERDYEEYDRLLKDLKSSHRKYKTSSKEQEEQNTKQKGDALEKIVNFIIDKSFFLEVYPNRRTATHEIDQFIVLSDYGKQAISEYKFAQEMLGFNNGYFIAECKNYNDKVGATWVGKFYTLLKTCGCCDLGIIFSYKGLTGSENNWYDAHGLTKVIYQLEPEGDKIHILDFNKDDFELLKSKSTNLFKIIKNKKLSLISGIKSFKFNEKHEGEEYLKKVYDNEIKKYI